MNASNLAERIRKLERLAARPGTPGEGAAARAAIERVKAKLPLSPPQPVLSERVHKHIQGLLRTVANTHPRDRAKALWWATCCVRDKRRDGQFEFEEVEQALAALRWTALAAGLGGWETERAISNAMKSTARGCR